MLYKHYLSVLTLLLFVTSSCEEAKTTTNPTEVKETVEKKVKKPLSAEFKKYWYSGKAEISSYKLEQVRYGEIHEGHAVLIYVTEPFSEKQVKADYPNPTNTSVLKLNATKKFTTGIYPYSVMNSTFFPLTTQDHAIKTTFSSQEWCGHSFLQLNNKEKYQFKYFSYFESHGDSEFELEKEHLEDELWNKLRIDPNALPQGKLKMIPSNEFLVLRHKEIKACEVEASLEKDEKYYTYQLSYPELGRTVSIQFETTFPYTIEKWEEELASDGLKTVATRLKTMEIAYWSKNKVKDSVLRDSLQIK